MTKLGSAAEDMKGGCPHLGLTPVSGGTGGRRGPQLGVESSSAALTGLRLRLCRCNPTGAEEDDSAPPGRRWNRFSLTRPQPVQKERVSLLLEPVRDQYVTTYVLQLPGVSDKSLETPLFAFFPPRL